MARENDNNVEVIDHEDRRYKDDNYFNGNDHNERNNYSIRYHYGCGCPFGLPFFTNHFYFAFNYFTFLLNWMF